MSAVSSREKRLAIATVLVLCYAVVGFTARSRVAAWKDALGELDDTRSELVQHIALIDNADMWTKRYQEDRDLMPLFAADVKLDSHWYQILEDASRPSGFTINRREIKDEKPAVGDVLECAIECTDWKGSTENLVRFLHGLHSAGVMLDIRKLHIRPEPRNPGNLSGQFTLFCAYMRETAPANP
ncbi:MAG: hypothetical protein FWF96_01665 [Kiritimatiellaeota bacterium]|nr:hypothetical protein [Kiritimatiellota bacterium]